MGDFVPLFCCVMASLALPSFLDRVVRHLHRSISTEPSAHPPPRASSCALRSRTTREEVVGHRTAGGKRRGGHTRRVRCTLWHQFVTATLNGNSNAGQRQRSPWTRSCHTTSWC